MTIVSINDKKHPIHFGNATIAEYQAGGGRLDDGMNLDDSFRLIYSGLRHGYRKAKKEFPFDNHYEVADLFDEDPEALERVAAIIQSAYPDEEQSDGKKKPKVQRVAKK